MKSAIGIDVGGTNIKVTRVSERGEVVERITGPTPPNDITGKITMILRDILKPDVIGIGVGVAGIIDKKRGVVLDSPNIPTLNNSPLKETLEREFSLPVIVENDANAYAYSEKWAGAGKDFDNFVALTLGTGLGSGAIYKGELFEGAMEAGHIVVEPNGRSCPCGSFGCLESYVSGRAIVNKAISLLEEGTQSILRECCNGNFYKITSELVYRSALDGDNLSREIFREVGRYLGMSIANLINIFSPEAIIIGGGLIGAWDFFIEELKVEVSKKSLKPLLPVKILKSIFPEEGGSIGAAGLVFERCLKAT